MTIKKRRSECPISFALDLFGDKWSLLILRDLLFKNRIYYQDFLDAGEGISTNILANRLENLEAEGLISKNRDPENGRKYIYSATQKSRDLVPVLGEMIVWSSKYDPKTGVPSVLKEEIKKDKQKFINSLYPD